MARHTGMCRQFIVSGRVQGVFYRVSTADVARPLDVKGHAINLPDGTVEVVACGEQAAVDTLAEWLCEGPPAARVTSVEEQAIDCRSPNAFTTA